MTPGVDHFLAGSVRQPVDWSAVCYRGCHWTEAPMVAARVFYLWDRRAKKMFPCHTSMFISVRLLWPLFEVADLGSSWTIVPSVLWPWLVMAYLSPTFLPWALC